jgi:tetratricopeptide (TPR) repeat protein
MSHLAADEIRALRRQLGQDVAEERVLHFLTCNPCRRRAATQTALGDDWVPEMQAGAGRSPLLRRALAAFESDQAAAARDRESAAMLLEALLAETEEKRPLLLVSDPHFASPHLGLLLIEAAALQAAEAPREGEALADLARKVASRLEPPWSGSAKDTLAGRAAVWIAESRRVRGDLTGAEAAFEEAREHLEQLPPFTAERAELCHRLGRLRRDQGRDDEALAVLARALEVFESQPEAAGAEGAAECALDLGWMLLEELETAAALPYLEQAAAHFPTPVADDPGAPNRWRRAHHGLALAYADLQWDEPLDRLLARLRDAAPHLSPLDRLRLARTEADIAQSIDQNEKAAAWLGTIWKGLREEGAPQEALEAALDLARLLLEQERVEELRTLKEEVAELRELPASILEAADRVLRLSLERGLAAVEILEATQRWLRRAQHDPSLPPPAPSLWSDPRPHQNR